MYHIYIPDDEQQETTRAKRFGRWVASELVSAKKTQQDLADALGISRKCLNRHINEGTPFNHYQLVKIFRFFCVNEEEIVRWME